MKKIFFLFLAALSISAKIIESDSLLPIFDELVPNTLVVFDIDNTIAHPAGVKKGNSLGSDEWFTYMYQHQMDLGMSLHDAIAFVLPVYFHVQLKTPLEPVDPTTPELIKKLQAQDKVWVMAVTARSFPLMGRTIEQMDEIDVNFSSSSPLCHNKALDLEHNMSICRHGIIFSGNNKKGDVLFAFAKESDHMPAKVIFIDDKEKYLVDVESMCKKHGIEFFGIRYSAADQYVHGFNPEKVNEQLTEFLSPHLQRGTFGGMAPFLLIALSLGLLGVIVYFRRRSCLCNK